MGAQLNTLDWTPERVAILAAGWAVGDTSSAIARRLKDETGCSLPTRSAVIGKAFRLKLPRPEGASEANMYQGGKQKGRPNARGRKGLEALGAVPVMASNHKAPPIRAPGPNSVTVVGLGYFGCRFPVGEETGADQLFCGEPTSGTYCQRCRGFAYTSRTPALRLERLEALAA